MKGNIAPLYDFAIELQVASKCKFILRSRIAGQDLLGQRRKADRRGITLVELLVVIAIVGLLLLPAIHASRESARATLCVCPNDPYADEGLSGGANSYLINEYLR